jgi:hypothetical protein
MLNDVTSRVPGVPLEAASHALTLVYNCALVGGELAALPIVSEEGLLSVLLSFAALGERAFPCCVSQTCLTKTEISRSMQHIYLLFPSFENCDREILNETGSSFLFLQRRQACSPEETEMFPVCVSS